MLKSWLAKWARVLRSFSNEQATLRAEFDRLQAAIVRDMPGNPAGHGFKVYSQADEDGMIAHIFDRVGAGHRTFIEIGCSDGLENNTHALLLLGWRGAWIDADSVKMGRLRSTLPDSPRLILRQAFVTPGNVTALLQDCSKALVAAELDFLSLDIDGRDLDVAAAILEHAAPRVVCVEYNAKFPPPMRMNVSAKHPGLWAGDDYQGASLASFNEVFSARGYVLVGCSVSGVNAFFVRGDLAGQFPQFAVDRLFQPARYHLRRLESGHPPSLKFLIDALAADPGRPEAHEFSKDHR